MHRSRLHGLMSCRPKMCAAIRVQLFVRLSPAVAPQRPPIQQADHDLRQRQRHASGQAVTSAVAGSGPALSCSRDCEHLCLEGGKLWQFDFTMLPEPEIDARPPVRPSLKPFSLAPP